MLYALPLAHLFSTERLFAVIHIRSSLDDGGLLPSRRARQCWLKMHNISILTPLSKIRLIFPLFDNRTKFPKETVTVVFVIFRSLCSMILNMCHMRKYRWDYLAFQISSETDVGNSKLWDKTSIQRKEGWHLNDTLLQLYVNCELMQKLWLQIATCLWQNNKHKIQFSKIFAYKIGHGWNPWSS